MASDNKRGFMAFVPASKQILGLAGWLVIAFIAAAIAGAASINAGSFYTQLVLPEWAPPSWLFGPAWTVLYALMGIAAWLVWRAGGFRAARGALTLFLIQLALNALWTWLFFGWHRGAFSFADILFLWVLISATLIAFWRVRALAGVLLVPYLLWVSFASALNYGVILQPLQGVAYAGLCLRYSARWHLMACDVGGMARTGRAGSPGGVVRSQFGLF